MNSTSYASFCTAVSHDPAIAGLPQPLPLVPVKAASQNELQSADASSITKIQLPPPNMSCYKDFEEPKSTTKWLTYDEPTITKNYTQNFHTCKTSVKENHFHHQHVKTIYINVNRNYHHLQRVVCKDNHYHHYLTNNIIRVKDIHHQKVEQVRGECKTFNDYKSTQKIEPATCAMADGGDQCPPVQRTPSPVKFAPCPPPPPPPPQAQPCPPNVQYSPPQQVQAAPARVYYQYQAPSPIQNYQCM